MKRNVPGWELDPLYENNNEETVEDQDESENETEDVNSQLPLSKEKTLKKQQTKKLYTKKPPSQQSQSKEINFDKPVTIPEEAIQRM